MKKSSFSSDIVEFLYLLYKYKVRYLIVGGEAVIYYGHARLTGDIDIFYERNTENVNKIFKMLNEFWNSDIPGIRIKEELMKKGDIFQFGVPPNRIDLMNTIEIVPFEEAWKNRKSDIAKTEDSEFEIFYIGLDELLKNKSGVKRHKDKEDIKFLKEIKKLRRY